MDGIANSLKFPSWEVLFGEGVLPMGLPKLVLNIAQTEKLSGDQENPIINVQIKIKLL